MGEDFCAVICLACIGFLFIPGGVYLALYNEGNLVCTEEALEQANLTINNRAAANRIPTSIASNATTNAFLDTCDPRGKRGEFVHLECPVDDSIFTEDVSTGIIGHGAYQLDLFTQQYGYVSVSSSEQVQVFVPATSTSPATYATKTVTCYCYQLAWTYFPESHINLNGLCQKCLNDKNFRVPHVPRGSTAASGLGSYTTYADSVTIGNGAFVIGHDHIAKIANKPHVIAPDTPTVTINGHFQHTDSYHCGRSSSLTGCWYSSIYRQDPYCRVTPCAGDVRLIVDAYGSKNLSVLGQESETGGPPIVLLPEDFGGKKFPPCGKKSIFYVSDGIKSKETLFKEVDNSLQLVTNLLRFVSLVLIIMGYYCFLFPLEAIVSSIPCIGDCLGSIIGGLLLCFSLLVGSATWSMAFGIAWVFYRPAVGIPFFIIACVLLAMTFTTRQKSKNETGKSFVYQNNVASPLQDGIIIDGQSHIPYGSDGSMVTPLMEPKYFPDQVAGGYPRRDMPFAYDGYPHAVDGGYGRHAMPSAPMYDGYPHVVDAGHARYVGPYDGHPRENVPSTDIDGGFADNHVPSAPVDNQDVDDLEDYDESREEIPSAPMENEEPIDDIPPDDL